ncbi:MAG TPA: hypothetical protein VF142_22330 [Longimicrobium sp.]
MPALTLRPELLVVESFPTASVPAPGIRPTTTGPMNTNEPGCTLPELCGDTPII